MRPLMIAGAAAALLTSAACGGDKKTQNPAPETDKPASIEADTAAPEDSKPPVPALQIPAFDLPSQLEREEDTYLASAQFPDGLGKKAPKLAERLKTEAEYAFDEMATHSAQSKAENPEFFRQMEVDIVWTETVEAGRLLSLSSISYVDGGGAHPNRFMSGVIHDTQTHIDVKPTELFADAAAAEALLADRVQTAVAQEKAIRFQAGEDEAKSLYSEVGDIMPEDGVLAGDVVLIGSNVDGKVGGMTFLYEPYSMGAYAEGSYIVTVPQRAFASLIKPEYENLFDGEPTDPFEE